MCRRREKKMYVDKREVNEKKKKKGRKRRKRK